MICQGQHGAFAMIGVAIMIAVDEVRSDFAQVVCPDCLAAQRTEGLPAARSAIDQYEPHVAPPSAKQKTVSDGLRFSGGGAELTEPAAVVLAPEPEASSALF